MPLFEGNKLTELAGRLCAVFVARNEILTSTGALAQLGNYNIYQASSTLNLTTAYQDMPSVTVTATPTVAEYWIVRMTLGWNFQAGTAICNASDVLNAVLNVDTVDNALVMFQVATGGVGIFTATLDYKLTLATGSHTVKVRAKNATGARGRVNANTQMTVWRIPQ